MKLKSKQALHALLVGVALSSCANPPTRGEGTIIATGSECLAGDLTNFGNPQREGPLTIVVTAPPYAQETRFLGNVTKSVTIEEEVELRPQDGRLSEWWLGEHHTKASHTIWDPQTGASITESSEETFIDQNERFCVDSKGNVFKLDVGPIFGMRRGPERG